MQPSKTSLLRRYAAVEYSFQFVPRVVVRLARHVPYRDDQDKHEAFVTIRYVTGPGERLWSADRS